MRSTFRQRPVSCSRILAGGASGPVVAESLGIGDCAPPPRSSRGTIRSREARKAGTFQRTTRAHPRLVPNFYDECDTSHRSKHAVVPSWHPGQA